MAAFLLAIGRDRHGNVIAGHGRLLAAQELGGTEVPTVCLDHLTPSAGPHLPHCRIAHNKLTENAEWDDRLLAQQLKDLLLNGLDFSLKFTGFEMGKSICGSSRSTIFCLAARPGT